MSLTVVKGLQSEIFVPITPPSVWTPGGDSRCE